MCLSADHRDNSRTVHDCALQSVRREAPKIGGSFAVWGGLFSTFDCSFVALRKKVRPADSLSVWRRDGMLHVAWHVMYYA